MNLHDHVRGAIKCVRGGAIGSALLDVFFPDSCPVPKECALWDYKEAFDGSKVAYAELAKDILSFFNSYGGYLFLGVSETAVDEKFSIVGFDKPADFVVQLRGALESYCSSLVEISVSDITVSEKSVISIFIPCRPVSQSPAFLTKNGPEKKPGRPIFMEKTTYFRQFDRTVPATIASQWEFLNSSRNADDLLAGSIKLSPMATVSRVIPNNLPDRNLICTHLFGRDEILASLWAWIADELEPVRLLAGVGGKGKTSIAYEFASRFFRNAPLPFIQVLWVSAKRVQFRADRNEYVELPECWYSSPRELLEVLCLGTAGITQQQLDAKEESEYTLQRTLRESLRLIPSLIVVDDIDSLDPTQQKRVFEIVQQIAPGGNSKFLLTTRANFAFSDTQCILVPGLDGEPYESFVADRLLRFGVSSLSRSDIRPLQKSSGGSPLWTDSILRLVKQGYTLQQAVKEWGGKPGEDARSAALKKELQALSVAARRILYGAAILRDCSRAELLEVTHTGKVEFDAAITQLQMLFLVDSPKIIEREPRFSVPESTATAVLEAADELVADHRRLLSSAREFSKKAAAAAGASTRKKVGLVVKQVIALMSANQIAPAIETVDAALSADYDNPDLLMLKGRCLRETKPSEAVAALNASFKHGQRRPLLFDMWYQTLLDMQQFAAASDVVNLAIDSGMDRAIWLPLRARTTAQIAMIRFADGSLSAAVELLFKAASDLSTAKNSIRNEAQVESLVNDLTAINDAAWEIANRGTGLEAGLLAYDSALHALNSGDYRSANIDRLLASTRKLVAGVDLSANTTQARAAQTRISDALRGVRAVLSQVSLDRDLRSTYEAAIASLGRL
ncbi:ATP-binding protein [Burkholderia paludis]|uniref:ATP-binding protein n=1 Tax=Burkholderia paludis TaxID=1506587 RepID=UPI0009DE0DBF|nr:ATP-binding protein [Burkholderia paludis]